MLSRAEQPRDPLGEAPLAKPAFSAGRNRSWGTDATTVLKALRRSWPLVIACIILCAGAALLHSKSQAPVYEASTLVEMTPQPVQPLGDKGAPRSTWARASSGIHREYFQTEYQIVLSDKVLGAVVRDLSLANDADFLGYKPAPARRRISTGPPTSCAVERGSSRSRTVACSSSKWTTPIQSARSVSATPSPTPIVEQNLQTAVNSSSEAVVWLDGPDRSPRGELEHDENQLYDFKERNNLPSLSINDGAEHAPLRDARVRHGAHARAHARRPSSSRARRSSTSSARRTRTPFLRPSSCRTSS